MAVKIRLKRTGKKKQPYYRVVVSDSRKPRDSKMIERIGFYDPKANPSKVEIDEEKVMQWLENGAQPTTTTKNLLQKMGIWAKYIERKNK
ncbi:MAG TPA: 30S ribosomal protein S16 [Candidatus Mcinerneyibacterium sp.]|nr:30S ribosomal protein S16 [Candidatus Mcinerneyibacterium sp.]